MSQFVLQSNITQINAELQRRASRLVRNTAFGIQTHIRLAMAEPKTGAIYGRHQASAPGEAPAIDTSALVNSISVAAEELHATIGTNIEYSEVLEFGGVHIAPRPYFGPAFKAAEPEFEKGLKELIN